MARAYGDLTYGADVYGGEAEDPEGTGPGNGGERFTLQLAPNGSTTTLELANAIGAGAGGTVTFVDDTGLPASGGFAVTVEDEVIAVRSVGGGGYGIQRRGLSNTTPVSHPSGADASWDDTYSMAIVAQVGMPQTVEFEGDTLLGWLIAFDASQGYTTGSARYPMHVAELTGLFPPGETTSRTDGPQPSAVAIPEATSDDCPAAMTVPARLTEDVIAGDVALCRFTNPTGSVLTLGPRAVGIQGWYGLGRRDDTNADVTLTDPDGNIVDGTAEEAFFEEAFITTTLPGDDRTFTYGPPRFSNRGWPIGVITIRHGKRRVPLGTSPTWHDFDFIYTGFHADALFAQVIVNRNGIVYGPLPDVDLPHPDDIDGPDATWDATSGYYTSTAWYVGIFNSVFIALGPTLNLPPSPSPPPPDIIPIVPGTPPGGGGGVVIDPDPEVEGGDWGNINPPAAGVGVHMHTDLGETGAFLNPPL